MPFFSDYDNPYRVGVAVVHPTCHHANAIQTTYQVTVGTAKFV